ncbi:cyclic pyranopterin monophosphate synthase MoaC, partial [Stygiolobus sp. CP850M]
MTEAKIVDISKKDVILREAIAEGFIKLKKET